jgi:hypothetical protein
MVATLSLRKDVEVQARSNFLFVDRLIVDSIVHNFLKFLGYEFRFDCDRLKAVG